MSSQPEDLLSQWVRDGASLVPDPPTDRLTEIGADLVDRWSEPQRHYHTVQHLAEMLDTLEHLARAGAVSPPQLALARVAAWFHDAVYAVPDAAGNEAASASVAAAALAALGVDAADRATVDRLIRASERHELPTGTPVDAAFHDADLWILAAPTDRFDEYCVQVRQEYAAVPDGDYRAGRSAVLRPFMRRDRVYATEWARARWEATARRNLARELARLAG